jgi:hypothetical protein
MSPTLIAVLGHAAAKATIERHAPYWEKAECDIVCVGRKDIEVPWPSIKRQVGALRIGNDGYAGGLNHLERLMILLRWFAEERKSYSSICVIEYDGVFLGPLRVGQQLRIFMSTPAGGSDGSDGFAPCTYFHTPWWFDHYGAQLVLDYGSRMLNMQIYERGFVDRWLGLLVGLYRLPWSPAPSFSVNSLDRPEYMAAAREAVRKGAVYVHGVKTELQLKHLTAP